MPSKFSIPTDFTGCTPRGLTRGMLRTRISGVPFRVLGALGVFSALTLGCSDDGDDDGGNTGPETIALADENNYGSVSALTIPTFETASGVDIDICWADLVEDIQCHELDPVADIDQVAMLRLLNVTEDDVEAHIENDDLPQSAVDGYVSVETDHETSCTKLSTMTFLGTEIDLAEQYVANDSNTYMLLFAEGTTIGQGARSMAFLQPSEESDVTRVDVGTGCGLLEFTADLSSAPTVPVTTQGPYVLDWSGMTKDSQGKTIIFQNIDRVVLGFYAGMSVGEIETNIFDLELMATELYEIDTDGERTADLSRAIERDSGAEFESFERDEDGVWLVGLLCGGCRNPAPLSLSVLEPQDP
jgi:hypothetical protein